MKRRQGLGAGEAACRAVAARTRDHVYAVALATVVIGVGLLSSSSIAATRSRPIAHIYWSSPNGTIGMASLSGSGVQRHFIGTGVHGPAPLAVAGSHIYWANPRGLTIGTATLNGKRVMTSLIRLPPAAQEIQALTADSHHIFWVSNFGIGRANLDGRSVNDSFIPVGSVDGIAVDKHHLYWSNQTNCCFVIGRANLDGTGVTDDFITTNYGAVELATNGRYIYWRGGGANSDGAIGRANVNGSGVNENFITSTASSPLVVATSDIDGLVADGQHIYFGNPLGGIEKADLNGRHIDTRFISRVSTFYLALS